MEKNQGFPLQWTVSLSAKVEPKDHQHAPAPTAVQTPAATPTPVQNAVQIPVPVTHVAPVHPSTNTSAQSHGIYQAAEPIAHSIPSPASLEAGIPAPVQHGENVVSNGQPQEGSANDVRSAYRARTLKAAKASFNEQFCAVPCVIKNISQTGALLRFTDEMAVPTKFFLHVDLDGYKVECERVWQRGTMAGVRFISDKKPTHATRSQVLKPSERALDQQTLDMMKAREEARRSGSTPQTPQRRPQQQKPTFGKRV